MRKYCNIIWLCVIMLHKIMHTYSIVSKNVVTDNPFTNSNSPAEQIDTGETME